MSKINWTKLTNKIPGYRESLASSPQSELNEPKNFCVYCISNIEDVCPNVPINLEGCAAHNDKDFYELCVRLKLGGDIDAIE